MEEGSLRCDANISIRRPGAPLGVKTELKNMNSFRFLQRGLEAEIGRQVAALEAGETVVQETVHFDPVTGSISTLRSKEEAHDYRYFPEPDLVPINLDEAYVDRVRASLPELPAARKERLMADYTLSAYDAGVLAANASLGDYFEQVTGLVGDPKLAANWVMGDFSAYLNADGLDVRDSAVSAKALAELLVLIRDGTLSGKMAKEVFEALTQGGGSPREIVEERGLGQISDAGALEAMILEVIAGNPKVVEEYRGGNQRVMGFFVGQVMKRTKGQANPQLVNEILRRHLGG
jgi:aspartyl-tRNA(Asn)/glutamyl-tRNA(Gln) amidotransferase subunit B